MACAQSYRSVKHGAEVRYGQDHKDSAPHWSDWRGKTRTGPENKKRNPLHPAHNGANPVCDRKKTRRAKLACEEGLSVVPKVHKTSGRRNHRRCCCPCAPPQAHFLRCCAVNARTGCTIVLLPLGVAAARLEQLHFTICTFRKWSQVSTTQCLLKKV